MTPTPSAAKLMKSFREYRDNKGDFSDPQYVYTTGVDGHPKQWWEQFLNVEGHEEITKVCVRLFSVPSSSAAVERAFSAMNWVHSIKRNSLSEAAVAMLMAIILSDRFGRRPELRIESVLNPSDSDTSDGFDISENSDGYSTETLSEDDIDVPEAEVVPDSMCDEEMS